MDRLTTLVEQMARTQSAGTGAQQAAKDYTAWILAGLGALFGLASFIFASSTSSGQSPPTKGVTRSDGPIEKKEKEKVMEDMLMTMGISIILASIKNPKNKAKLKKAMLKVRNAINAAYASDPDFEV
jgi:hypothetical protein